MATKKTIALREEDMTFTAIRAQGAGGQNVNKVSNAVHLRYAIGEAELPEGVKERLMELRDHRITAEGVIIIKAQTSRSLESNRAEAIERLQALVDSVAVAPIKRRATKPTRSSQIARVNEKKAKGAVKQLRQKRGAADD